MFFWFFMYVCKRRSCYNNWVGEITNMISGQARQQLEQMNKSMQAAIPTVVTGKEHQISYLENRPIMAIPFKTDHGEFTIEVCIE